jgi:iron complex outermembrane recepter protein
VKHRIIFLKALPSICASTLGLVVSTAARAQTAANDPPPPTAASSNTTQVQEVVVYATKKSVGQVAQSLPISISAVTAQTMEKYQPRDLSDLQQYVPNASLRTSGTSPGMPNFEIRGIGVNSSVRSVDQAVTVVQDGMVMGYPAGSVLSTFDLCSVEVLRGPQGVLFGRNASAGAIVTRTCAPTAQTHLSGSLSYGNFNETVVRTSVEGQIEPDLFGKLAVMYRHNDGYFKNTLDGTFVPARLNPRGQPVPHETGGRPTNDVLIKPTFLYRPSNDLTLTLFTQYEGLHEGGAYDRAFIPPGTVSPLQTRFGYTPPTKPYVENMVDPGYVDLDEAHVIGQADWNVGPGKLTAIAAYRTLHEISTFNSDGTPFGLTIFPDNPERNNQETLEVRYAGDVAERRISYVVGTFFYDAHTDLFEKRKLSGLLVNRPFGTFVTQVTPWDQLAKSAAVFGNVDWQIFRDFTLSTGLRFSDDDKDFSTIPLALCAGPGDYEGCPTHVIRKHKNWSNVSPRVVLNWNWKRDHILYASYSEGYRAGNFNGRATTPAAIGPTNPETVTSFEIGSKNQFFDKRARLNLTLFRENYQNIERTLTITVNNQPVQSLVNAASAIVQGVEAEVSVIPFRGFRIDANTGLTDAHYDTFNDLPPGVNGSSLRFDRLSKWRYTVGGAYDRPVGEGTLSANASWTWRSFAYTDVLNTPQLAMPAYGLLDAGLSYRLKNFRYSLYGRNLTNRDYWTIAAQGLNYFRSGGQPMTFGAEIAFDY